MRELIFNAPQEIVNIITIITSIPNFVASAIHLFKKTKNSESKLKKSFWIHIITGVTIIVFYIFFVFLKSNMCRVPDIEGWTYYNAVQTLDERNISYEFVSNAFDKNTAEISYQSYGNNELIFSWEKLVLGLSSMSHSHITSTTSGNSSLPFPEKIEPPITSNNVSSNNEPDETHIQIPTIDFLDSDVTATLEGSTITITIDKSLFVLKESNGVYPFRWGLRFANSFEANIDDTIIELEICIDNNYSVISIDLNVLTVQQDGYLLSETLNNEFTGTFNGEEFVFVGDISNNYIDLDELCIQTAYHCLM